MIPALADGGRSFKGAAAYYLHDKREAGEEARSSADRVAWTETVNLPTNDPDRAWKMMAHTALAQSDLKAAAGIKATGRKLAKPVFAYSLSWHPSERPTREEQMKAARDTLKVMGLEAHQALVVSHNDEPHPHVHVLVNRVNPETGVAAKLDYSQRRVQEWALAYTKARGTDHLTPAREENAKARQKGEKVDAGRKPRAAYEAEREAGNDNLRLEFVKTEQRQKDAQLYQSGRQLRDAHARQWRELGRTYGVVRERLKTTVAALKTRKTAEIKEGSKYRWRDLFRQQREDRANFDAAERGTLSKIWSMAFVFQAIRQRNPDMDVMTMFYCLVSSSQRRAVFEAAQEGDRRDLAQQIRKEVKAAHKRIDQGADKDFEKMRAAYKAQCGQLQATHDKQHAQLKAGWQARNAERRQALAPFKTRAAGMKQGRPQTRGRSIRDDDRYRPPPKKPDQFGPR